MWQKLVNFSQNLTFIYFIYILYLDFLLTLFTYPNLPIQYLKHATEFLAMLCQFEVLWGILPLFLVVCDVTNGPKEFESYISDLIVRIFVQIYLSKSDICPKSM